VNIQNQKTNDASPTESLLNCMDFHLKKDGAKKFDEHGKLKQQPTRQSNGYSVCSPFVLVI
jgi:hypothetical protein